MRQTLLPLRHRPTGGRQSKIWQWELGTKGYSWTSYALEEKNKFLTNLIYSCAQYICTTVILGNTIEIYFIKLLKVLPVIMIALNECSCEKLGDYIYLFGSRERENPQSFTGRPITLNVSIWRPGSTFINRVVLRSKGVMTDQWKHFFRPFILFK